MDPALWDRYLKNALKEKSENVKATELSKHTSDAIVQFRQRRIYFPEAISNEIERYLNLSLFIGSQFRNVTYHQPVDFETQIAPEMIKTWVEAVNVCNKLLPRIESLFRERLGIDEDKNA